MLRPSPPHSPRRVDRKITPWWCHETAIVRGIMYDSSSGGDGCYATEGQQGVCGGGGKEEEDIYIMKLCREERGEGNPNLLIQFYL